MHGPYETPKPKETPAALAINERRSMNWGIEDLVAAVALLGSAGLAIASILRFVRGRSLKLVLLVGVIVSSSPSGHLAVGIV